VQLDGEYQVATYDRSDAYEGIPSSDFQVWAVEGRLIRRFSRIFDGYLFYRYGQFEYTDDNLISVPPGTGTIVINEDYAVHDARIGFTYNVAADMALDAYGGWALKVNDITDNQDGFVGGLTFRQALQRGGYRIEAIAGYEATQQRAVNLGFERYYGLGFTGDYALTRHLTGDAYAAWRRSEYIDTIPERIVDRYRAGAGLAWQPYPWGRIRLAYLFRTAFSGIESEEYTENRIYLTLSLATELPYRALF
jgi:hypothetical protein